MRFLLTASVLAFSIILAACQAHEESTTRASPVAVSGDHVSTWVVGVDGVGCPFCAYGLEKKLGGLDGVESFAFRFEDAEIDLGLSPGAAVAPDALAEAVDKAGFGLRSLVVIGQGTVSTVDGRRTLRLGPGLTLNLVGHDGPDGLTEVRGEVVNQAGAWSVRLSPI